MSKDEKRRKIKLRDTAYGVVQAPSEKNTAKIIEMVTLWESPEDFGVRVTVRYDSRGPANCVSHVEMLTAGEQEGAISTFKLLWDYPSNWYDGVRGVAGSSIQLYDAMVGVTYGLIERATEVLIQDED